MPKQTLSMKKSDFAPVAFLTLTIVVSVFMAASLADFDPRPCRDPAGRAIADSLVREADDWTADRYYLTNAKRGVRIWRNDIEMSFLGFSTTSCRVAMRRATKAIEERDRARASRALASRFDAPK